MKASPLLPAPLPAMLGWSCSPWLPTLGAGTQAGLHRSTQSHWHLLAAFWGSEKHHRSHGHVGASRQRGVNTGDSLPRSPPYWLFCPSCFPNTLYFIEIVCKALPLPPTQLLILQQGSVCSRFALARRGGGSGGQLCEGVHGRILPFLKKLKELELINS